MIQLDPQPEFAFADRGVTAADRAELLRALAGGNWLTRRQLCPLLQWPERKVRAVAESAGADVVRGPRGFALTATATADEIAQAAAVMESQAAKMSAYAVALRRRAHAKVG